MSQYNADAQYLQSDIRYHHAYLPLSNHSSELFLQPQLQKKKGLDSLTAGNLNAHVPLKLESRQLVTWLQMCLSCAYFPPRPVTKYHVHICERPRSEG